MTSAPWVTHWGEDAWSWNVEGDDEDLDALPDGMPGRMLVGGAVSLWSSSTPGASADDAAGVFNLPLHLADDVMPPRGIQPCDLGEALQVWSLLNGGSSPVDLACVVFGRPLHDVLAAVDDHPWMLIETRAGTSCIGHEGE